MRRRVLLWLLLMSVTALLAELLADGSGYVGIRLGDWLFEMRPMPLFILLLLGALLIVWGSNYWRALRRLPESLRRSSRSRRQLRAIRALLEANTAKARRLLGGIEDCTEVETLTLALAAWRDESPEDIRRALQHLGTLQPSWGKGIARLREQLLPEYLPGEEPEH
ncbi:MAG: hypothetical protein ISN29_10155 [Gammaproteobacteria bacterium AqS3]|nr:hypothetical protein [Gammaproteobacteria bacterium AqS3]